MNMTKQCRPTKSTRRRRPAQFDPQAVGNLATRFLWFLAQREHQKRAAHLKGRNRAALMKV